MSTIVNCPACGGPVAPEARFCAACGSELASAPAPAATAAAAGAVSPAEESATVTAGPPPPAPKPAAVPPLGPQAAARLDQLGPGASDFAGMLLRFLRSPGVVAASTAAAIGAAATFLFGLLVAIVFPVERSIVGGSLAWNDSGGHVGILTRAFRQAAATLLVPFSASGVDGLRPAPSSFLLVPLVALAFAAARQGRRLRHLPARQRLRWGAMTAVPFALLMLIPLLMSGNLAPSFGWTLVASLGWAGAAGCAGAWWAIRRDAPETLHELVPARGVATLASARTALAPLALVLVVTTILGTGMWVLQTVRGVDGLKADRSLPTALVEDVLYAGAHGIHYAELGSGTAFRLPEGEGGSVLGLAVPVTKTAKLYGRGTRRTYRLFDYHRALPAWAFLLLAAVLVAIPALMALYAGFALARARTAATPAAGAAWGAAVGPAWALAMAVLSTLFAGNDWFVGGLFGAPEGGSVFVTFLLGGAALGALGGLLGTQGAYAAASRGAEQEATHV